MKRLATLILAFFGSCSVLAADASQTDPALFAAIDYHEARTVAQAHVDAYRVLR